MSIIFDGSFHLTDTWAGYTKPFGAWSFTTLPSVNTLVVSASSRKLRDVTGKITHYTAPTPNESTIDRGLLTDTTVANIPVGSTIWCGFSMKLDAAWKFPYIVDGVAKKGWELFWEEQQIFGIPHSPNLSLQFMNGDNPLQCVHQPHLGQPVQAYNLWSLAPGTWYDIMVHVFLTTSNNGYFHIYMRKQGETNYTLVLSKTGIPTLLSSTVAVDTAIGYYRTHSTVVKSIYYENIKYGTARADVERGDIIPCPPLTCNLSMSA